MLLNVYNTKTMYFINVFDVTQLVQAIPHKDKHLIKIIYNIKFLTTF